MARVNVENARALYPSCDMGIEAWVEFFSSPAGPTAMGRIIYDIYDEVKSQEEKAGGLKRIGRRPARSAVPLEKIMGEIFPEEFGNEPFVEVLRKEMRINNLSQGQFAYKIPCTQSHLSRVLSGERPLNLEFIERAAKVLNLRPWRFPEWRALYMGQLVTEVLLASPNVGTTVLRNTRRARARHDGALDALV